MTAPGPAGGRGLLGAVLAGGASRRFGSPKALARLHGRPLWRVAAERLAQTCDRVLVVANDPGVVRAVGEELEVGGAQGAEGAVRGQAAGGRAGWGRATVAGDRRPGRGPLGGIDAALHAAAAAGMGGALVLAADMAWVEASVLMRLAEAWRSGGAGGGGAGGPEAPVVPRTGSPWGFEPLCAVYPIASRARATAALDGGDLEAGAFARSLGPRVVEVGAPHWAFRSVNRPGDLPPPAVSVVGNKNSGKTTLTVALIAELAGRGHRVMSVKHGHHFRLDTPGTDSWHHRHEGRAERVLLAGPDEFALMGDWPAGEGVPTPPPLDLLLSRHLHGADVVVVEGFRSAPVPKIEVFRAAAQPEPVLPPRDARKAGALAVVTDQPGLPWSVPAFDPDDPRTVPGVAGIVEDTLL